jgi:5-carboxymethyl-2-hydroxymuconate isomerase
MPHVVIQYTDNLEAEGDMPGLCKMVAASLLGHKGEDGKQLFPIGGTRVLAYPAHVYAVADGKDDYAFCYINVRIASGRSDAMKKVAGDALLERVREHFASIFGRRPIGITLQIDESPGQVYDGKHSNLHSLFPK